MEFSRKFVLIFSLAILSFLLLGSDGWNLVYGNLSNYVCNYLGGCICVVLLFYIFFFHDKKKQNIPNYGLKTRNEGIVSRITQSVTPKKLFRLLTGSKPEIETPKKIAYPTDGSDVCAFCFCLVQRGDGITCRCRTLTFCDRKCQNLEHEKSKKIVEHYKSLYSSGNAVLKYFPVHSCGQRCYNVIIPIEQLFTRSGGKFKRSFKAKDSAVILNPHHGYLTYFIIKGLMSKDPPKNAVMDWVCLFSIKTDHSQPETVYQTEKKDHKEISNMFGGGGWKNDGDHKTAHPDVKRVYYNCNSLVESMNYMDYSDYPNNPELGIVLISTGFYKGIGTVIPLPAVVLPHGGCKDPGKKPGFTPRNSSTNEELDDTLKSDKALPIESYVNSNAKHNPETDYEADIPRGLDQARRRKQIIQKSKTKTLIDLTIPSEGDILSSRLRTNNNHLFPSYDPPESEADDDDDNNSGNNNNSPNTSLPNSSDDGEQNEDGGQSGDDENNIVPPPPPTPPTSRQLFSVYNEDEIQKYRKNIISCVRDSDLLPFIARNNLFRYYAGEKSMTELNTSELRLLCDEVLSSSTIFFPKPSIWAAACVGYRDKFTGDPIPKAEEIHCVVESLEYEQVGGRNERMSRREQSSQNSPQRGRIPISAPPKRTFAKKFDYSPKHQQVMIKEHVLLGKFLEFDLPRTDRNVNWRDISKKHAIITTNKRCIQAPTPSDAPSSLVTYVVGSSSVPNKSYGVGIDKEKPELSICTCKSKWCICPQISAAAEAAGVFSKDFFITLCRGDLDIPTPHPYLDIVRKLVTKGASRKRVRVIPDHTSDAYSTYNIKGLKAMAKELGIAGISKMRRKAIVAELKKRNYVPSAKYNTKLYLKVKRKKTGGGSS